MLFTDYIARQTDFSIFLARAGRCRPGVTKNDFLSIQERDADVNMSSLKRGIANLTGIVFHGGIRLGTKTLLNYAWAFARIPGHVPLPVELQIEPSSLCNLRCRMCSMKNTAQNKGGFFNTANFSRLMNALEPTRSINLTGMGESLLNRHLPELAKIASDQNVKTAFITNGQLLSKELAARILESNIISVAFSVDSVTPHIYEGIREGAKLDVLIHNISMLTALIQQQAKHTHVILNVTLQPMNVEPEGELVKIIEFASAMQIGLVTFQNLHDVNIMGLTAPDGAGIMLLKNRIKEMQEAAGRLNVKISYPSLELKPDSCYYPWVYPQVTANGELLPCCVIPQFGMYEEIVRDYSFGNVFQTSFRHAWNSANAVRFRSSLARKKPCGYCQRCSKYWGVL